MSDVKERNQNSIASESGNSKTKYADDGNALGDIDFAEALRWLEECRALLAYHLIQSNFAVKSHQMTKEARSLFVSLSLPTKMKMIKKLAHHWKLYEKSSALTPGILHEEPYE